MLLHGTWFRKPRSLPVISICVRISCAFLSKIKTLINLELCGGGVGDFGCAQLATLSNLESLNLSQNERITNQGAAALAALTNLKALNLSNTCVTPIALKYFSGLLKLQSLALYGCRDMIDSPDLDSLQSELPSLRCVRLNSDVNEDGVINHDDSESDDYESNDDDTIEGDAETVHGNDETFPYHSFESEGIIDDSDEDIDDFESAHHDHDEIESLGDDMMGHDSRDESGQISHV